MYQSQVSMTQTNTNVTGFQVSRRDCRMRLLLLNTTSCAEFILQISSFGSLLSPRRSQPVLWRSKLLVMYRSHISVAQRKVAVSWFQVLGMDHVSGPFWHRSFCFIKFTTQSVWPGDLRAVWSSRSELRVACKIKPQLVFVHLCFPYNFPIFPTPSSLGVGGELNIKVEK